MLVHRVSFGRLHGPWMFVALAATAASMAAYAWEWPAGETPPGGGSWTGLACGSLAGLLCLFEFALVVRKTRWFRTRRRILGIPLGTARAWMAAHIWLGLLTIPLVVLHTGFRFGGPLASLLAWSFILVISSGVVGLVLQNVLPRLLTESVPEETIDSQIDAVGKQFAADAVRLAQRYGGPGPQGMWDAFESAQSESKNVRFGDALVVGAPRRVGTLVAATSHGELEHQLGADAPELHDALHRHIVGFLETGRSDSSHFSTSRRIQWYFDDLRRRVLADVAPAVEQIESLCQQRRQLNRQRSFHFWLHSWLSIHLPLSVALLWLLAAHVVGALVYS